VILVVEDSVSDRLLLEHEIERRFPDQRIEYAESVAAARAICEAHEVTVAVVDNLLTDGTGLELVDAYPAIAWIVVTGTGSERVAAEALRKGAVDYVIKEGGHLERVARAIDEELSRSRERRDAPRGRGGAARTGVVRFGDFELDLDQHELSEGTAPVLLHRMPMRLLTYLVRNANRTIGKDELLEKVWSGVVVSDMAIASALKELRRVLRDDGVRQLVIETRRGNGYRFVAPLTTPDASPRTAPLHRRTLAVLPLQNLSSDPEQEYFALGMTDVLNSALTRIDSLRVTSRASVTHLRGRALTVRDIGRALGVDFLVSGSIAREGPRVRIHAELLEVRGERLLWADNYDRFGDDVLALESEVACAIVREIQLELSPRDRARLHAPGPQDPAALDAFLMGKYLYRIHSRDSVSDALDYFLRAVDQSPDYAAAHVAVAECYGALCSQFHEISAEDAIPLARAAVNRALDLDCFLGEAHAMNGALLAHLEWRWSEAESAFHRAVELSPGNPDCLMGHAKLSAALGRFEPALGLSRRALALDPFNLPLRLNAARVLWCARRYDEALAEQQRIAVMDPRLACAHLEIGATLHHMGRDDDAVEHWCRAMALRGISAEVRIETRCAFEQGGMEAYWRRWLELADEVARYVALSGTWMWLPCAAIGDLERAFAWLERDVEQRAEELAYLKVSPFFDRLHGHPRFDQLLDRMQLA
jgi:TolB-like protein/DNA-binding response OmpR family regulator/Tfp pilus assembly protein PilF